MSIKKSLYISLLSSILPLVAGKQYEVTMVKSDPNPAMTKLLEPVFNQGISHYLKETFNLPFYAQEILPYNFSHFIELILHGNKTRQPKLYFGSTMRLFSDKLKSSPCVSAYAYSDMLEQIIPLLQPQFSIDASKVFGSVRDIVNEMLLATLVRDFAGFKANPGTFLESVSADIEDAVELRKVFMFFLETSLNKLVWSPQDQDRTWENVKRIAQQLQTCHKQQMIANLDDLNSLYISLIERFCFFLDITNAQLPSACYQRIKEDVTGAQLAFLEIPEQEKCLETKSQRILRAVYEGETKARAREQGILV